MDFVLKLLGQIANGVILFFSGKQSAINSMNEEVIEDVKEINDINDELNGMSDDELLQLYENLK